MSTSTVPLSQTDPPTSHACGMRPGKAAPILFNRHLLTESLQAAASAPGETSASSQTMPLSSMAVYGLGMFHPILANEASSAVVGPVTSAQHEAPSLRANFKLA